MNRASVQQQFFRQRCFSRIRVRDDGKISATIDRNLKFS
jgi:hypothetical protein